MTPYHQTDRLTIWNGDALEVLKTLPGASVQCCVTSPPYDKLRTYNGDCQWNFEGIAKELYRVLIVGGVLCWNVNDSTVDGSESLTSCDQKIYFRRECGFLIHDTMIYEKVNFSHPERVRYHQVFEYVFVLSKGNPLTWNPIRDKRNTYGGQRGGFGVNTYTNPDGSKSLRNIQHNIVTEFGMRGNVWRGNTRGQEEPCASLPHPAMMPKWLVRDLIISWSNPGDTVLDPFFGSGTTGEVALELGRKAVGIELNPDYCALAKQRTDVTPGLALA